MADEAEQDDPDEDEQLRHEGSQPGQLDEGGDPREAQRGTRPPHAEERDELAPERPSARNTWPR